MSRVSGRTRITPVLKHLHWLPVHLRAEYKLLSIVFSVLNTSTVPIYLRDLLIKGEQLPYPRSNSSSVKLDVARAIRKTGERAFAVCASSRWNSFPAELRQCDSLESFKHHLTHFFNVFFNVNDVSDDSGC